MLVYILDLWAEIPITHLYLLSLLPKKEPFISVQQVLQHRWITVLPPLKLVEEGPVPALHPNLLGPFSFWSSRHPAGWGPDWLKRNQRQTQSAGLVLWGHSSALLCCPLSKIISLIIAVFCLPGVFQFSSGFFMQPRAKFSLYCWLKLRCNLNFTSSLWIFNLGECWITLPPLELASLPWIDTGTKWVWTLSAFNVFHLW